MTAYRVQADDGRGPWRPGWSHVWSDPDISPERASLLAPWSTTLMLAIAEQIKPGEYCGYGCLDLATLAHWFTPAERRRLKHIGFRPVLIDVARILRQSDSQVFFARNSPLNVGAIVLPWSSL
jgi:hypothetical protein